MEAATSFGGWMRQRRKAIDLTQDELAHRVGCSLSAIRKIEANERRPSRQVAELLAECLGLSAGERQAFVAMARGQRLPAAPAPVAWEARLPAAPAFTKAPLVGRERELAQIVALLGKPECRLLTLTGIAGIGKTRLALAVAAAQREEFGDGAAYVSLAQVGAVDFLVPAIAAALGFTFHASGPPREQLLHCLAERETLLVLDSFEHLLHGTELLVEMLEAAPGVKLLVTSRERLNVRDEWLFEVPALAIPADAEHAGGNPGAVDLFVQAAQRVRPGFTLTAEDYQAVARLCRLVEGLPLAIELAAAWVRVLSCSEIVREIERDLAFLAAARRDVPERHRSVRAAFDHSWELLAADERSAFACLSVFRGDFSREAAEQVAGAGLPLLSALVDKSLVRRAAHGRYDVHELLRQYAALRLQSESGAHAAAHQRHARFYLDLLRDRTAALRSARQPAVVAELAAELDDLRAAWEWAAAHACAEDLRRAFRGVHWLYELRGLFEEGAMLCDRAAEALEASVAEVPHEGNVLVATLGLALVAAGYFHLRQGRYTAARARVARAVALLRAGEDRAALADGLMYLGVIENRTGCYAEARDLLAESLALNRELNRAWETAMGLAALGAVANMTGELEAASRHFRESLDLWHAIGDPRGMGLALTAYGTCLIDAERHDEAGAVLHDALALGRASGDRWAIAIALDHLGLVAHALGRHAEADELFCEGFEIFEEFGDHDSLARTLVHWGHVELMLDKAADARRKFKRAYELAVGSGSDALAMDALAGLAAGHVMAGESLQALECLAQVERHPASSQTARSQVARLRAELAPQAHVGVIGQ